MNKLIVAMLLSLIVAIVIYFAVSYDTESPDSEASNMESVKIEIEPNVNNHTPNPEISASNETKKHDAPEKPEVTDSNPNEDITLDEDLVSELSSTSTELDSQDIIAEKDALLMDFQSEVGTSDWGANMQNSISDTFNKPEVLQKLTNANMYFSSSSCKQTVCQLTFNTTEPIPTALDSRTAVVTEKTANVIDALVKSGAMRNLSSELSTQFDDNNSSLMVLVSKPKK